MLRTVHTKHKSVEKSYEGVTVATFGSSFDGSNGNFSKTLCFAHEKRIHPGLHIGFFIFSHGKQLKKKTAT